MIQRTEEEIRKFIQEDVFSDVFNDKYEDNVDVEVRFCEDGIRIEVTRMYDPPGLSFEKLSKLAEFFGTDRVGDEEFIREGGCETCDYGSKYGFVLLVQEKNGG